MSAFQDFCFHFISIQFIINNILKNTLSFSIDLNFLLQDVRKNSPLPVFASYSSLMLFMAIFSIGVIASDVLYLALSWNCLLFCVLIIYFYCYSFLLIEPVSFEIQAVMTLIEISTNMSVFYKSQYALLLTVWSGLLTDFFLFRWLFFSEAKYCTECATLSSFIKAKCSFESGTHGRGEKRVQGLGGKARRKRPLERPKRRWEDGIKTDLREIV
jgi:hypothetical protein